MQVKGGRVSPANRQEATQANKMMVIIIIRENGEGCVGLGCWLGEHVATYTTTAAVIIIVH